MKYLCLVYGHEKELEAGDLDEAIEIASKIPPARVGSIEIRPIRQLKGRVPA